MARKRNLFFVCVHVGFIALSTETATAGELMWAVNDTLDLLYSIDIDTGATTIVGPPEFGIGITGPVSLTTRPNGDIYGDNDSPANRDGAFTVYMPSGTGGILANSTPPTPVGSVAFDWNGVLYTQLPASAPIGAGTLGRIHQWYGVPTSLGGDLLPQLHGLDFNAADGFLYGISGSTSGNGSLLKIGINGTLVSTTPLGQNIGSLPGALAFDSNGRLVASNLLGQLFDIDPSTGAVFNLRSVQGGASFSPQGLARIVDPAVASRVFHWRPWVGSGGGGGHEACCNTFAYWDGGDWEGAGGTSGEPGIGDIAILDASQFSFLSTTGPWETHVRFDTGVSELRLATPDDHLVIDNGSEFIISGGPVRNN